MGEGECECDTKMVLNWNSARNYYFITYVVDYCFIKNTVVKPALNYKIHTILHNNLQYNRLFMLCSQIYQLYKLLIINALSLRGRRNACLLYTSRCV